MSGRVGDESVWSEYVTLRERYFRAMGISLASLIVLFLAGAACFAGRGGSVLPAGIAVVGVFGILALVATVRYSWLSLLVWTWPCPRCGSAFALSWWAILPPKDRCRHCGVAIGAVASGPDQRPGDPAA